MKVRNLINELEQFDEDMNICIGMIQNYGSNFAMNIIDNIAEHTINSFYGDDFKAVVITEGNQVGVVNYNNEDEEE